MSDNEKKEVVYVPAYPGMMMPAGEELNLLELWRVVWDAKFFIAGLTLAATLIAAYVSLYILPVTYKSEAVLLPIQSDNGALGKLAGLAGGLSIPLDLPGSGKTDHILSFLQSRTLKQRLIEKYDLLPRLYEDDWDAENRKWRIAEPEKLPTPIKVIQNKALDAIYQAAQDKKTALISISWVDKDPAFAAAMLQRIIDELQHYLDHEYESDAQRERIFVEGQLTKATHDLEQWEKQVPSGRLTETSIQRERLAAQTVYMELRKQVELARIAEAKELVRFKILDSPYVPEKKFKPRRGMICALTLVVTGMFSLFLVFGYHAVRNSRRESGEKARRSS